ncbi:Rieske (2Fe-2S) protein [Cohnella silvisoli]|uniref:Rieske (2Fe-2S) protein n=1 Tax=Cohnella silvisoli TaxID=2873699 RepID=A0ABV1KUJ6_9BACL|nr:Rieske (2Fe-2S) protein [Cohnella silvisoli]MCD9022960.1 Rieske (2Fe-2S) protein [Cohnella silvisoli]
MSESEIDLGPLDTFTQLPTEITLENTPYWLVRTSEGEYRLLLAICPHAGGEIRPLNDVLFCPLHFWTFNAEDGTCLNDPDERLMQRKVRIHDNHLFAIGVNE